MKTAAREQVVEQIIEVEWQMFRRVRGSSSASCQNNPKAFSAVRGSIFQLWPDELLASYLQHLQDAAKAGRNLLTEKYARMDKLIPPLSNNPLLDKIVSIEVKWQEEIQQTYPALYQQSCRSTEHADNGSNFSVYLRAELETYGEEAIELYYAWVAAADARHRNMSITMLENLVVRGGFSDLEQAEAHFSKHRTTAQ